MSIWNILGIEQTGDARTIKRAYARQLRLHNPEDDPAGFMKLRDAYERAIEYSRSVEAAPPSWPVESVEGVLEEAKAVLQAVEETGSLRDALVAKLEAVYNDFPRRMDMDEWRRLLDSLSINELHLLQSMIVPFLNEHYHLPAHIYVYLDAELDFADNPYFRRRILMDAQNDVFSPLINRLDIDNIDFDIDMFDRFFIEANIARQNRDFQTAIRNARKAIEIFDGDYLIHRILGDCLLELAELSADDGLRWEAAEELEKSLALRESINLRNRLANLWENMDEFEKALVHYKYLVEEGGLNTVAMQNRYKECEIKYEYQMNRLSTRKYKRQILALHPERGMFAKMSARANAPILVALILAVIIGLFALASFLDRARSSYGSYLYGQPPGENTAINKTGLLVHSPARTEFT